MGSRSQLLRRAGDKMSHESIEDMLGDSKEYEERGQEFAERAQDAADRAMRERHEASKWPGSSELRTRHEKEAERWSEIAERYSAYAGHCAKRSEEICMTKICISMGYFTFQPGNERGKEIEINMLVYLIDVATRKNLPIVCQRCGQKGVLDETWARWLQNHVLREKAAARFFRDGWRFVRELLCPECSGADPNSPTTL